MTAVGEQRLNDRHRKVVALRVSGLTCGQIAQELGYRSVETVYKVLALPAVRAYREMVREQLAESLVSAHRFLLADAVERSAFRRRVVVREAEAAPVSQVVDDSNGSAPKGPPVFRCAEYDQYADGTRVPRGRLVTPAAVAENDHGE